MELDLLISDHKIPLLMILSLVGVLVFLRVSGHSRSLIEQDSNGDGDPIAEAEFHMAYGMYDKAAQAIRKASIAEPASADLAFKLLEVHFASGKADEFLTQAWYYKDRFGRSGHWNAIREMGQKLVPGERLFR